MNIYIWRCVEHLTDSEHDTGGVVAVAENLEHARDLLRASTSWSNRQRTPMPTPDGCEAFTSDPDMVYALAVGAAPATIVLFPDQGCC